MYVCMLDAVLQRTFVVDSRSAGTFEFVLEDLRRGKFACVSDSKGQCVVWLKRNRGGAVAQNIRHE